MGCLHVAACGALITHQLGDACKSTKISKQYTCSNCEKCILSCFRMECLCHSTLKGY